ncbi:class I SAM-dependent methyltransferase [bacterium]|nr:class I SAM-dependent methyltransferase [bacterium]
MNSLHEEELAFDRQINERLENDHLPDLRKSGRCEYFLNNVWRDQYFANLYYGELIEKICFTLKSHFKKDRISILEVGCGPGHVTLELARNGFIVTGIDISGKCIEVARKTSLDNDWSNVYECPEYHKNEFLKFYGSFDVIIFIASLHHFPDCDVVLKHCKDLLNDRGLIIIDEPCRDLESKKNAVMHIFIEKLLSMNDAYYEKNNCSSDINDLEKNIECRLQSLKYVDVAGQKVQSVHDNESGYKQIYPALKSNFQEIESKLHHALFHSIIGGIRKSVPQQEHELADTIKLFDELLCEAGCIDPTNIFFVGEKS